MDKGLEFQDTGNCFPLPEARDGWNIGKGVSKARLCIWNKGKELVERGENGRNCPLPCSSVHLQSSIWIKNPSPELSLLMFLILSFGEPHSCSPCQILPKQTSSGAAQKPRKRIFGMCG